MPAVPSLLLQRGQFDKSVDNLAGHTLNEGLIFTPPFLESERNVTDYLSAVFPDIQSSELTYIRNALYPDNETYPGNYTTAVNRIAALLGDFLFTCNVLYLNQATAGGSYSFNFAVPPSYHGSDLPYTFYDGEPGVVADVAETMQRYFGNFARTGDPNAPRLPNFPTYGQNTSVELFSESGFVTRPDETSKSRCAYWQKALYF